MMNKKTTHNKKRNVGIIYEQLMRKISEHIVDGDNESAIKVVNIVKKHFKPGTELYKEFRLFNALVKTQVSSSEIAAKILVEAREAAKDHNSVKLMQEKSRLIKEINHTISSRDFYTTRVPEYRTYATIQTLMNDWRDTKSRDISRIAIFEDKIHSWLLEPKSHSSVSELKTENVDNLVVNVMRDKLNKKYETVLSSRQMILVKEHALREANGDSFTQYLKSVINESLGRLADYKRSCNSTFVEAKIPGVVSLIETLQPNDHSDQNIAKFMTVLKLCDEITGDKDE
jgi:hypothetical protein